MRVLLDEDLPIRLRHHFVEVSKPLPSTIRDGKAFRTVRCYGRLLRPTSNVFVTIDQGVPHQQNIEVLQIGVVVIEAVSNDIETLTSFMPEVNEAVQSVEKGTVVRAKEPS